MKVLISPGIGYGWSSACADGPEAKLYMLTYEPLIDTLEVGADIGFAEGVDGNYRPGSVLERFAEDYWKRFDDYPPMAGAATLKVADVDEPFRVGHYDGGEFVEYRDRIDWIDPETALIGIDDEDFD